MLRELLQQIIAQPEEPQLSTPVIAKLGQTQVPVIAMPGQSQKLLARKVLLQQLLLALTGQTQEHSNGSGRSRQRDS